MKIFRLILLGAFLTNASISFGQPDEVEKKVEAYYFHFTVRCETCRAVEAAAKENLEVLYSDLIKEGRITFQALNLNDKANKPVVERLKVPGQSLLLVQGETQINITNEAFLYARPNPEKFKAIMKEKVDGLLK